MFLNFTKFGWLFTPVRGVDGCIAGIHGAPPAQGLGPSWLMRLVGTLLFLLLSLLSSQASAASTCPSPRAVSIVAGGEYYEDYTNAPCSQFGLTGTLVAPLYGTLEDSNATNAVRYRNTNLSATSDTFTVRDDVGQPIVYNVTITSAIVLAPATVPNATVAQPYSTTTVTATGGAAPYTYAISAGALPAGMSLSGGGVLSGTPTAGGTFNFTVRATDSLAVNGTRAYTLTVSAPTIAILPTTLPAMTAGLAYSQTIAASGGTGTYTYARTAGSLPAGLTLASNGTLSGTPTAAGAYSFTVTATDSSTGAGPYSGARAYSGTVAAGAPTAGAVSATVAYGSSANPITLNLGGGAATSVAVASAASNGTASASGTSITYTPTAGYGGPDSFTYTASNGIGTSTPATVTITVSGPTITLAPSTVPAATVGTAYSQSVTAANGGAPYTYAISAGALPAGLSLNTSTGLLSGTPTAGGTFNFTVRATDSSTGSGPYSGARGYSLTVSAATVTIAPTTLPAMTAGLAYSQSITAAGGTAPHSYAITAGSLPAGLILAADGTLSGTPTATGAYSFTVTAIDSSGGSGPYSGARAYSGTVAVGAPVAGNVSATVSYGSSTNPITLNLSGGAATSVAVASAASHGTATSNGTSITYTPTAGYGGPDSFTYTASNGVGTSAPATVTITVGGPTITITPSTVPAATVGTAYSENVTAANGAAPYIYAISAGALPAGVSLNTATGLLSGTPTAAGTFNFTVRAEDSSTGSGPYAGARSYSLTVAAPTISIAPSTLPAMTAGVAFSQGVTPTGGTAAYSYAVTAGSLPTGLTLAADGTLSGTPAAAGAYSFTITATDSSTGAGAPFSGSRAYSGSVAPGAPIAGNVSATVAYGSSANPITLSLSGGAATSVAVASAASHGTATASGTSITYTPTPGYGGPDSFSYTASNGIGTSAPATVTITVGGPTIVLAPSTVPAATVGTAYSQSVTAANGTTPYTYTISAGTLPAGVSLNTATGLLSGTPTAVGTFNFTVLATDSSTGSGPYTGARAYSLTVAAPTISIAPSALPAMTAGVAFSQGVSATGGTAAYSYAVTAGSLPTGLTLAADGTLSGTPAAAGAYSFTITATDSSTGAGAPFSGSRAYSGSVAPGAPIAGAVSATVAYGSSANPITLSLSGGAASSVAVASAASHGTATASGTSITYTPTAGYGGSDSFTYTATNGIGTSTAATVTITVGTPTVTIVQTSVASATVGAAYSQTLTAANGLAPYTYAVSAGALPAGVTLSNAGLLAGTPTAGGTFNFTVRATDSSTGSGPYAGTRAYSLTVAVPAISVAPAALPAMTAGVAFSQGVTATGGTSPYGYAVTAGSLPTGLTLEANGTLSGTPTVAGAYSFSITATDSSSGSGPYTGVRAYTGTVAVAVPVAGAVTTTVAYGSSANPITLNLGGGAAASVAVASPPAHGTATASGTSISYTPTTGYGGSDSFTYTATNGSGTSAPATVMVTVGAPAVSLIPATLPNPVAESPYSVSVTATGGMAPYTYSVTSGSLPAGLTLNASTGVLSGTTNVAGSFPFSIKVTDSSTGAGAPFSATNSYTLSVGAPTITVTPATLPAATAATAYSRQLTANGGVAPYAYTVSSGSLPAGLTLSGSGLLSGTPTAAGSFTLTVQAEDAHQFTGTQSYTLTVASATVSLTPASLPNLTAEAAYSATLTATGGTAPYSFAVIGSLPAGLSLNASTGVLSGTTNVAGSFPFSIKVTDSSTGVGAPFSATNSYTLAVAAPTLTLTPASLAAIR
ncbi:S-layer family protein, partial [Janthinobacterium sp. HH104]|uniref:beta strand repeat-containing protein n=1 Tax=Janthinobacterium sp. HH104 TaxID=1537276 RepID=UPI00111303E6